MRIKILLVSGTASLSQKVGFAFIEQIWYFQALYQYSTVQKIQKKISGQTYKKNPVWGEIFWKVLRDALFSQKEGFVFVDQVLNF